MAERGIKRKATYYYGARTRKDLFYLEQMQEMAQRLPNFTFVPVLSAGLDDTWEGEKGFVTDVVERAIPAGHRTLQIYLCGPGPMIDVALPMLARKGISEDRIFYDKFTPTGSA
jgi:propane monooxygenase reductase subunit